MLQFRKRLVLAKVETTYGVDAAPVGGDAILLREVTLTPYAADARDRGTIRDALGASPQTLANRHVELTAQVELAGAGTAGSVPGYGPLLRGCGFSQTISDADDNESVIYQPVSTGYESVSFHFYIDGVRHKMLGSRGNVAFRIEAGEPPVMDFSFIGLWETPTTTTAPQADFTAFQKPLAVGKDNTPVFMAHGASAIARSIEIDMNNAVKHIALIGSEEVIIGDRDAGGRISLEAKRPNEQDWFATVAAENTGAFTVQNGNQAGEIVELALPAVQILAPSYEDYEGYTLFSANIKAIPHNGDDELVLTVK